MSCLTNLIFSQIGDLTAENFFKELTSEKNGAIISTTIDNVLIRLDKVLASRAIINLNGSIMLQVSARSVVEKENTLHAQINRQSGINYILQRHFTLCLKQNGEPSSSSLCQSLYALVQTVNKC